LETLLIEGEIKILDLPGQTILNLDLNENGTSDDEIFQTALERLDADKYAYSMVHFHSIDDAGHISGPQGDLTRERIQAVDEYVGQLVENWPGPVIITADHGMHQEGETGSHWNFRAEDVTIPYLIVQGGESNEQAE
jgi:predicted AlkP superfamily pyrophosphatase or phosphodiesterase